MSDLVLIDVDGPIATVSLNRADKRNGLNLEMFEALVAAGESVADNRAIRAVVLRGTGKAFCAGLDFKSFMTTPGAPEKLLARDDSSPANLAQRAAWIWQEVPVPVIAALHGATFGGGLQIALAADIRFAAPDTELSVMEMRWGLIPDMSITQTLLRLVPLDVAKELTFTHRTIGAEEAQRLRLITRVADDPVAAATGLARVIAGKSPHAIRAAKRLLNDANDLNRADALKLETELQVPLFGSPNQLEAVQANMAQRPPEFSDPTD